MFKVIILHDFWRNLAVKKCDPYVTTVVRIRATVKTKKFAFQNIRPVYIHSKKVYKSENLHHKVPRQPPKNIFFNRILIFILSSS